MSAAPRPIQFTRDDTLHAALGVVPAVVLVAGGRLAPGIAFAIGLLPTSLMGIAPTRVARAVYGLLGCLFGVGVFVGSNIVELRSTWEEAAVFFVLCAGAALIATRRPAGGMLLALLIPSLAVGTSYPTTEALTLMIAFMLGSLWSSAVSLLWPELPPSEGTAAALQALQPANALVYGALLGLTAATALLVGAWLDPGHPGWAATAALLVMRPLQDMAGLRGVGRAASTILGTLLVVVTIQLGLGYVATAVLVAVIAVAVIGARTSRWYVTSFGTAFLILTIELYGSGGTEAVRQVAWLRILDNVAGALLALLFGLAVPLALDAIQARRPGTEQGRA